MTKARSMEIPLLRRPSPQRTKTTLAENSNGTSLVSTLYFNKRLQPCRISVKSSGTAPASCTAAGAGNVLDFSFNSSLGTADNGNLAAIVNNRDATRSENFTYDALNRLATAQTQTSGVTIPNPNCWGLTFGYDAWSNLLTSQVSGPAGCSEPLPLNATVSTLNRLLTNAVAGQTTNYCFDSAGNLVHSVIAPASCPATGPYQSTYDAENHLTSAGGVTYTYDGDGRRVKKSNGKLYWYGLGSDPLDETDLAGNTNNTSFKEYVFFAGKRVARRDYLNSVSYYFSDYLNTTRVVTNASGTVLDDSDFYPFGGERSVTSSSGNSYKFTGKERDPESGFDNFGARFMNSVQGRFNSIDPGSVGTSLGKPQALNRYAYAGNNPLRFTDPDGKYPREQHEFFTFWLAAVAQKYNGRTDAAELAAGAGKADNFWNATTGLLGLGYIINYKKHFGTPPKDIRQGIKGGFDAHLVEDHKGPDSPHARGSLYHIYTNIIGRSVDTADSSFGGFRELGKMLGIPDEDPVFTELEDVRKYANSMNAVPFQVIFGGVPYGKAPEKSWTPIETKHFGNTTVTLFKPPDNSQEWHDFFLPGEDPVEHERKRICAQGDPAACHE
jgi:RHS repeat-associated protein